MQSFNLVACLIRIPKRFAVKLAILIFIHINASLPFPHRFVFNISTPPSLGIFETFFGAYDFFYSHHLPHFYHLLLDACLKHSLRPILLTVTFFANKLDCFRTKKIFLSAPPHRECAILSIFFLVSFSHYF